MKSLLLSIVSFFVPVVALAADASLAPVNDLVTQIGDIANIAIPIAVALAVLFFFWGLATYIFASGDSTKREEGRGRMIWGVVALFVIVSIWGIIGFIGNIFGVGQGGTAQVPGVGDAAVDPTIINSN